MIKAVAIDDEPLSLKVIENFCVEIGDIQLDKTFSDAKAGIRYLNKFPADLVFLDIDMPFINGIELYKRLKQNTMVIFITAREDCAVEGFNLRATDYLVKPFTFERFQLAVTRAKEVFHFNTQSEKTEEEKHLYIRADLSLIKIVVDNILFIEGLDDYIKISISGQKPVVARMTMKKMLEKLPAAKFLRVHNSFIVAINRVVAVRSKSVMLGDTEIPVSRSYAEKVAEFFKNAL